MTEQSGDDTVAINRIGSGGPWEALYGYSRAVAVGPWIVSSGCTATVDGRVVHVGDAAAQTKVAFRIALDAIVEAGGAVGDVVRTRMYVTDESVADAVGRAHGELFGLVRPVATLVVVAGLVDPDQLVEVEVEAYRAVTREIGTADRVGQLGSQYSPSQRAPLGEYQAPGTSWTPGSTQYS